MKKSLLSLSKLSTALAVVYASMPAYAGIQSADSHTQITRQNGAAVINIATPSAAGLSHNKYQKYNVDQAGAVLNNARQAGQSQLAGKLNANPNLQQGSAKVILNEVVSRNPSTLAGQQEIFGQRADYVLANPNGISVKGAGFINTGKASLVVGKATIENGALRGFDVTGENTLTATGKIDGRLEQLDLLAPKVNINAQISGSEKVNIIGGSNKISRADDGSLGITVQKATGAILDGTVAGSIQANRIRIHSTDERATLKLSAAELTAPDLTIQAENALFAGKVNTNTQSYSGTTTSKDRVKTQEYGSKTTRTLDTTKLNADNLLIDVNQKLTMAATEVNAKQAVISGGSTILGITTTTDSLVANTNRSKGRWYRNDSQTDSRQTIHQTILNTEELTLLANSGKLTAEAVVFNADEALLYGKEGIELRGKNQREQQTLESNYRNETARLRSGRNYAASDVETFIPTEFNINGNLRLAGLGDVVFSGVKGSVEGNAIVDSGQKIVIGAQNSQRKFESDDKEKYWGGLAGANASSSNVSQTIQHGSDIRVKGLALVGAQNGVQISGSRVLAGEGYVNANQGKLSLDSVNVENTLQSANRKGTVFNITKSRQEAFSHEVSSQGATLHSDTNLQLVTEQDLDVIGSQVQAGGLLNLSAKQINAIGAINRQESNQSDFQLGATAQWDKTQAQANVESLVNTVIDTWLLGNKVENPLKLVFDKVSANQNVTLGIGISSNESQETTLTHSASVLSGENILANAQNVTLAGSQLQANEDVIVNAENIRTLAQTDSTLTESKNTEVGITLNTVFDKERNINNQLNVGVSHSQTNGQNEIAQQSVIEAMGNVLLTAQNIVHQGSQINAGASIVETAEHIRHETAETTNFTNNRDVNVGLNVKANVSKDKTLDFSVGVEAMGSRETQVSSEHTATTFNAGEHIAISAEKLVESATQYQAQGNAVFHNEEHLVQSVANESINSTMSAGASVGVSGSTSDFKAVNLQVNTAANYQQQDNKTSNAQTVSVSANNIQIQAANLVGQATFSADNVIDIHASQSIQLNQANNSVTQTGGGFNASLGVGGIVTGGSAIPSVDIALSANGNKTQSQTAVANHITGKQVVIQAGQDALLQGTNVVADDVLISGKNVALSATKNQSTTQSGSAGVSLSVGKDVSAVKGSANASANVAKHISHDAVLVQALDATILAQDGIRLEGVQFSADNAILDSVNGGVSLNAQSNTQQQTAVSAAFALNGDVNDQKWSAKGGSASLNLDLVKNNTYTGSEINANTLVLNSGGDVQLNGSAINATWLNGNVAGDVVASEKLNQINEMSVALSANGSGKYQAYPTDNLASALKKDWDNGVIAGMKGEISGNVSVNKAQSGTATNVNVMQNNLVIQGGYVPAEITENSAYTFAKQGTLSTNLKQHYLQWRKQQFGQ